MLTKGHNVGISKDTKDEDLVSFLKLAGVVLLHQIKNRLCIVSSKQGQQGQEVQSGTMLGKSGNMVTLVTRNPFICYFLKTF